MKKNLFVVIGTIFAARRPRRKPLSDIELRQLFTIHATIHPNTNAADSIQASTVRIVSPFLLEKQGQKQTKH